MANSQIFFTSKGAPVQLTQELGRGGEGAVFATGGDPTVVAKIYHEALSAMRQEKLRVMVASQSPALAEFTLWPRDTLHATRNGPVRGFTMPRLGQFQDLHELYTPVSRKQSFPYADWRFLIQAARNVAAAVATMHQAGHVVGDINPKNFVVSANAIVKLIDCDSFQIAANGKVFPCEVGVPHYTAPELQGKTFRDIHRIPNHDNFALAVLCFQLLFLGRHPFAGVFSGPGDMPLERAISEFRYAYSQSSASKLMAPPPNSLPTAAISVPLRSMFEEAFGQGGANGHRPPAEQWLRALDALGGTLVTCPLFPAHQYHQSLTRCPWCELEKSGGIVVFIDKPQAAVPAFDIELVWRQILGIDAPAPVTLPQYSFNPTSTPFPDFVLKAQAPKWPWSRHPVDTVVTQRRAERDRAKSAWVMAKKHWDAANEARDFQWKLRELQQTKQQYDDLMRQYEADKRRLEANARTLQLNAYLDKHHINRASIPGIGAARRASLISFGIESAADINEAAISRIPGFGPSLTSELLQWRQSVERRFVFDPHRSVSPTDLAVLRHKYAAQKAQLEQKLLTGSKELQQIRQNVVTQRQTVAGQLEASALRLAQAEVDHSAASSFQKQIAVHRLRRSYSVGTIGLFAIVVLAFTFFPRLGSMAILPAFGTGAGAGIASSNNSLPTAPPTPRKAILPTFTPALPAKVKPPVPTPTNQSLRPTSTPEVAQASRQTPESSFAESIPSSRPTPVVATVRVNSNLRSGPGTQHDVLRTASPGTKVVVVGASNDGFWYHLAGGEWISADLVDMDSPDSAPATATAKPAIQWAVINVDTADVRSGADSNDARVATLRRGDCVQVNDTLPAWVQVRYESNKLGWCARNEVILVDKCPAPPPAQIVNEVAGYANTPMRTNATVSRAIAIHECFGSGSSELRNVAAGTPIEILGVGGFQPPAGQIEVLGAGPYLKIRLWDGQVAWVAAANVGADVARLPQVSSICEEYDQIDWATVISKKPPTPTPNWTRLQTAPSEPARSCCKVCTSGKACGDSCIAANKTCRQGPGCACNG